MGRNLDRTDVERPDGFCPEMDHAILILDSSLNPQKPLVQHDHWVGAIDVRHHHNVGVAGLIFKGQKDDTLGCSRPLATIAVIAIDRWSNITRQGIEFAARLSPEVIALHVEPTEHSELLQDDWEQYVEQPFRAEGKEPP